MARLWRVGTLARKNEMLASFWHVGTHGTHGTRFSKLKSHAFSIFFWTPLEDGITIMEIVISGASYFRR